MTAVTQSGARTVGADRLPLALTLLARALTHGAFIVWVQAGNPTWFDIFWTGGAYGLVDGTLGLVTAFLLSRRIPVGAPPALVGIALADGLIRIGAGVAIRAFPGIPDIPIVLVLFFGALGTWAAVAGAVAVGGWLFAHSHRATGNLDGQVRALFDPLSVAGLVALGLALYAVVMGPPATSAGLRNYATVACAGLSCAFLAAAAGASRAPRRSTVPAQPGKP